MTDQALADVEHKIWWWNWVYWVILFPVLLLAIIVGIIIESEVPILVTFMPFWYVSGRLEGLNSARDIYIADRGKP